MDPVICLKRPSSVDTTLCILCQERGGKLSKPGTQGMNTLTKATATRRKSKNDNFREVTDRLTGLLNSEPIPALTWHMKCYRPYTDSTKLKRLEQYVAQANLQMMKPPAAPLRKPGPQNAEVV